MAEINLLSTDWMAQVVAPGAAGRFVVTGGHVSLGVLITNIRFHSGSLLVDVTANSLANPTVVTVASAHGKTSGDTFNVRIAGSNSTPSIDGSHVATATGATTFTIPVNVTVAGTAGECIVDRANSTGQLSSEILDTMVIPAKLIVASEQGRGIFVEGGTLATTALGELVGYDA